MFIGCNSLLNFKMPYLKIQFSIVLCYKAIIIFLYYLLKQNSNLALKCKIIALKTLSLKNYKFSMTIFMEI